MPINKCTDFTAVDFGGSSELCNTIYNTFSEIDSLDNNHFFISEFSFQATEEPAHLNPIKKVHLVVRDNIKQKTLQYELSSYQNYSCCCELLLFIIVNFK